MEIKKWLKRKLSALALATSNVEMQNLTQSGLNVEEGVGHHQRLGQGRLSDALLNSEVTQEVKELRWRMYKVLQASEGYKTSIVGYKEDGSPITETSKITYSTDKIKVDNDTDAKVLMSVDNSAIALGKVSNIDDKPERPIEIHREFRPKFDLEDYTKKLVIREDGDNRILEFYVSKYPDEYNRKSRLFISECKKVFNNPKLCNMLDINEVGFITNKTAGAENHLLFEYKILNFHKIIEFDGHYVIKFIAETITNGENILEKFKDEVLEEKYNNKEAK